MICCTSNINFKKCIEIIKDMNLRLKYLLEKRNGHELINQNIYYGCISLKPQLRLNNVKKHLKL